MCDKRLYRIIGAFDTETTNIGNAAQGYSAFPILYQFGYLSCPIEEINPGNCANCVDMRLFRNSGDFYEFLDGIAVFDSAYVNVVLVHNLGFDMYSLAPWINTKPNRVLAKTARKPITITILDDNERPVLVFFDTLGLFMKSLARMGEECGMPKAVGEWDYMLVRTPDTPLTANEIDYATRDIYTLLCYVSYFLGKNPDISPDDIGCHIVTKTGVVRHKRMRHLGSLKGRGLSRSVNQYWNYHNRTQKPKSDEELFIMHACTRGGFTFCARNHASEVFSADDGRKLLAYDATSQHPGQICSHLYPVDFTPATKGELEQAIIMVEKTSVDWILDRWERPFFCAFNACFSFTNLRPKKGSMYAIEGVFPLASARIKTPDYDIDSLDNESANAFDLSAFSSGYTDIAENPRILFGKLESADYCELWLTELALWELIQCYDYDSCVPLGGYLTMNFRKPTDLCLLSVMRFYKAKNALKEVMNGARPELLDGFYPDSFVRVVKSGEADSKLMKEYYQLAKADLNALFGIEATNEARQDFEIAPDGLQLTGVPGMENYPANPKCWYQFGQRIVGWSRIAQHVAMQLVYPYVNGIICGDTDSFKLYLPAENIKKVDNALKRLARSIDKAKRDVCSRIRVRYKDYYDTLDGIGHYVCEGEYEAFSASWNKSYIGIENGELHITLAGVPTSRGDHSIEEFGKELMNYGADFASVASLLIGYNVTFDYSLTLLNGKKHPKWAEFYSGYVTDYLGNTSYVNEPMALAIYPEPKTIGNTEQPENLANLQCALGNNSLVNKNPVLLKFADGIEVIE